MGCLGIKPLDIHINVQNLWIICLLVKQKHYFLFLPLHSTHLKASIVLQTEKHTPKFMYHSSSLKGTKLSVLPHVYTTKNGTRNGTTVHGVQLSRPNMGGSWSYVEQPVCTRKCRQLLKGYISFLHTSTSKPYCSTARDSNTSYKNRQHNSDIELQPSFNWLPALSHFLKLQIANTNVVISKCVLLSAGDKLQGLQLAFWNINTVS